ncbi:DUF547 domain-containing protein [Halorubellus salinus]|uniref:DUF547 domain-containing protein n=1 Tax=Halorubellus salinus TaxID=755309 RepID=UPI001D07062A|nr:DUF547 domain-containing protein [Halorubellus salinus]
MTTDGGANAPGDAAVGDASVPADPISLSVGYVRATKAGDGDPADYRRALADLDPQALADALDGDDARLAFWLNVYNASVQDYLAEEPRLFEERGVVPRRPIFRRDLLAVAGESLSVDDVEHGILRRSRSGVGLGYVPRLRQSRFERRHRVDDVDPRVHFALNCGAASCPPVLAYTAADVDAQLDASTRGYLDTEVSYDPSTRTATVPKLFSWYRGDFGGKAGIKRFLREHDAVPAAGRLSLAWGDYDWTLKLGQYADA